MGLAKARSSGVRTVQLITGRFMRCARDAPHRRADPDAPGEEIGLCPGKVQQIGHGKSARRVDRRIFGMAVVELGDNAAWALRSDTTNLGDDRRIEGLDRDRAGIGF